MFLRTVDGGAGCRGTRGAEFPIDYLARRPANAFNAPAEEPFELLEQCPGMDEGSASAGASNPPGHVQPTAALTKA